MEDITRRLLDLPNGLRFRKLMFWWLYRADLRWMMALVVGCSETLRCLEVRCCPPGTFLPILPEGCNLHSLAGDNSPVSLDLSKATKLEHVVFRPASLTGTWVTMALQTITPKHREPPQISIHVPYDSTLAHLGAHVRRVIGERVFGQWSELDRFLVQFWESCSVRPKVVCTTLKEEKEKENVRGSIKCLLPEMTKGGIIDLVEHHGPK